MRSYYTLSWIPSMIAVAGLLLISSCKDDEKPRANIAFAVSEEEAYETDGTVEVKINIDKPLSETVVIGYELGGTAREYAAATGGDFEINPPGGYLTIAPGATEATIEIDLFEDGFVDIEDGFFPLDSAYETIKITLNSVVSGPAQLPAESVYTLKVLEDDLVVILDWDAGDKTRGDVDLDIILSLENPGGSNQFQYQYQYSIDRWIESGPIYELASIPAGVGNGKYAFSFVYYEGSSDSVTFYVDYINFGGTLNGGGTELPYGTTILFEALYKLDNIHKWDESTTDPVRAQTLVKNGLNYSGIEDIIVMDEGSRIKPRQRSIKPGTPFKSGAQMKRTR